jgi:hypothetical protein
MFSSHEERFDLWNVKPVDPNTAAYRVSTYSSREEAIEAAKLYLRPGFCTQDCVYEIREITSRPVARLANERQVTVVPVVTEIP